VIFWLRYGLYKFYVLSNFWRNLLDSLALLTNWFAWSVGNGAQVLLGQDPFVGCGSSYKLSYALIHHLKSLKVLYLAHIGSSSALNTSSSHDWLTTEYLRIEGDLALEWNEYFMMLRSSRVACSTEEDSLVWTWNQSNGTISVKLVYDALVTQNLLVDHVWWHKAIWKLQVPVKIILFVWLCFHDCILTGENYRCRGGIGPSVCSLCLNDEETT